MRNSGEQEARARKKNVTMSIVIATVMSHVIVVILKGLNKYHR